MAEITAAMVSKLRKMSGQGMMDCKKALTEADGDMDKAMETLRKKGLATLEKRADRETSEGLVVSCASDDGKEVAMATLCCETDFVAKNDDFIAATELLKKYAMACQELEGAEAILNTSVDGRTFSDVLTEVVSKTGEKVELGDYVKYKLDGSGLISVYIHFNKKVGTLLKIETSDDSVAQSEDIKTAANDVAMHVTATKPMALDESELDPKVVEQEKAIYADQVKDKPAEIVDKIVQGKMGKFFAENCLVSQPFVKDDSKTVGQVVEEAAKQAGGTAKLIAFARLGVG